MVEDCKKILTTFADIIIRGGDYTSNGIELAFTQFCDTVKVKQYAATPKMSGGFVRTTINEAIEAARQPVYIPCKINQHGNLESENFPGMLVKQIGEHDCIVYGIQDGPRVAPLSLNWLLVCQANGLKYDKSNTVGCAETTTSILGMTLPNTK
jgi:hypothetical protein